MKCNAIGDMTTFQQKTLGIKNDTCKQVFFTETVLFGQNYNIINRHTIVCGTFENMILIFRGLEIESTVLLLHNTWLLGQYLSDLPDLLL